MALWYPRQHISNSLITTFLLLNYIPYSSFSLEFDYPVLDKHNRTLITQGNTTYLGSEIQLTKLNKTDQIGHVKYFEDFQLWDKATGRVWDFTTSFSFIIYSPFDPRGDGLAFFLAQPPFGIPSTTDGSRMGLIEASVSTSSSHPFVAVEFDTLRNYFDPIDVGEHVGVNVKDMISSKYSSWSCNISTLKVYNATVSYSSRMKNLSVIYTGYNKEDVPFQQSLSYEINLTEYLPERVTFGFSAANGLFTSRHILRSWSFHSGDFTTSTTSDSPKKTSTNSKTRSVIGISVGVCVFVGALAFISFGIWKWKKSTEEEGEDDDELSIDPLMDNDFERSSGAKRFSYDELVAATNNFSEEEKLGQGGFGCVYRGFLKNMNSYVAIKKISTKSKQGIQEYASEVKIITQLRHRNLVQLIGWCHRKKDLLLIYEFMSNGSLNFHLFGGKSLLTWAASGLVEWVWKLYGMEKVLEAADPRLCGEFNGQQMERLMIVGLWCAHPDYNLRTSIKQAIHVLEFEAPLPALPLEMPLPTYLPPPFLRFLYGSTSASEDAQTKSPTVASPHTSSSQSTSSFRH
ncbi:hypothetical protein FEM48_Zijuj09G0087300 [Ziziphus jujuba var. spinosa]|uniref:non-specific serine/threonine protein kinase n=1 Tax=Ziziphus jujuba var. spinosa TaxID=714518 RepID=A0A978US02_ZIZJJ|nr:hypothetical protein FEM48_Zijuj09G0087300 [Ziziphus jujuba var. spinosa]